MSSVTSAVHYYSVNNKSVGADLCVCPLIRPVQLRKKGGVAPTVYLLTSIIYPLPLPRLRHRIDQRNRAVGGDIDLKAASVGILLFKWKRVFVDLPVDIARNDFIDKNRHRLVWFAVANLNTSSERQKPVAAPLVGDFLLRHNIKRIPDIQRQLFFAGDVVDFILADKFQRSVGGVGLEDAYLALGQGNA